MSASTILVAQEDGGQSTHQPTVLVIAGPTGSGKTGLALALATKIPIEIVNADSRAFYIGMDAGTAKPTPDERSLVRHHLVDILAPDTPMSVTIFQELANEAITGIDARNALPVVVGGSAQYLNALVEGWRAPAVAPDEAFRRQLEAEAAEIGVEPLLDRLRSIDPAAAERNGPTSVASSVPSKSGARPASRCRICKHANLLPTGSSRSSCGGRVRCCTPASTVGSTT